MRINSRETSSSSITRILDIAPPELPSLLFCLCMVSKRRFTRRFRTKKERERSGSAHALALGSGENLLSGRYNRRHTHAQTPHGSTVDRDNDRHDLSCSRESPSGTRYDPECCARDSCEDH